MTKRLCKYNRREIGLMVGEIYQLVREPQYFCRACARSANQKSSLCKPALLPVEEGKPLSSCSGRDSVSTSVRLDLKSIKKLKLKKKKYKKSLKKLKKILQRQEKLSKCAKKIQEKIVRLNLKYTQVSEYLHSSKIH